ncbi:MAG: hypothetical protein QNK82_11045 [Akkermansiaceae bacterium]
MNFYLAIRFSVLLSLFTASYSDAATIAFAPLNGGNLDVYDGHVEESFSVSVISGDWREGHMFGNPIPNILGVSASTPFTASIEVIENTTGLFWFESVDLAGHGRPTATYTIEGFLGSSMVLSSSGILTSANSIVTISSPNASQIMDTLIIEITPNSTSSFNVDNIVVTAVPEPSAVFLSILGFILLFRFRSRAR